MVKIRLDLFILAWSKPFRCSTQWVHTSPSAGHSFGFAVCKQLQALKGHRPWPCNPNWCNMFLYSQHTIEENMCVCMQWLNMIIYMSILDYTCRIIYMYDNIWFYLTMYYMLSNIIIYMYYDTLLHIIINRKYWLYTIIGVVIYIYGIYLHLWLCVVCVSYSCLRKKCNIQLWSIMGIQLRLNGWMMNLGRAQQLSTTETPTSSPVEIFLQHLEWVKPLGTRFILCVVYHGWLGQ